jgi:hypothetical protein
MESTDDPMLRPEPTPKPKGDESFEISKQIQAEAPWGMAHKVAFRFVFSYVLLYLFPLTSILQWFWGPLLVETTGKPQYKIVFWFSEQMVRLVNLYENCWQGIVPWFAAHILHLRNPVTVLDQSGDSTYGNVKVLCFVVVAALGTVVWSVLDRRRIAYAKLNQWLHLYVRVVLATVILSYGADKAIPTQMPPPSLSTLMQPFGDLTPYRLSWSFIGASASYQIFCGAMEMIGGVLLLVPGTSTLGAFVCLAALTNVFMLNMCYGIPVKVWALHLLLFAAFLLLPEVRRLANLLVLNRPIEPEIRRPLFQRRWPNRVVWVVQWTLGISVAAITLSGSNTYARRIRDVPLNNPLYGIWRVDEFAADGQARPPLLTDDLRWQRVIFTSNKAITIQEMSGLFSRYAAALDPHGDVLWLKSIKTDNASSPWWSEWDWNSPPNDASNSFRRLRGATQLTYSRPRPETMILEGLMNEHRLRVTLKKEDRQFPLNTRGFHWINDEYDFFNQHVDQINAGH